MINVYEVTWVRKYYIYIYVYGRTWCFKTMYKRTTHTLAAHGSWSTTKILPIVFVPKDFLILTESDKQTLKRIFLPSHYNRALSTQRKSRCENKLPILWRLTSTISSWHLVSDDDDLLFQLLISNWFCYNLYIIFPRGQSDSAVSWYARNRKLHEEGAAARFWQFSLEYIRTEIERIPPRYLTRIFPDNFLAITSTREATNAYAIDAPPWKESASKCYNII